MTETPAHDAAKQLFADAIELPDSERAAFLEAALADAPAVRERVESLLEAYGRAEQRDFLAGALHVDETKLGVGSTEPDDETGGQLGPYRLEALLGEGGFGRVYLARQHQPVKRTVAVKVLKPGMDSGPVIARFEAERQALARMEHPAIARILDAGTDQGRSYFVMEHVDGQPVTDYCDHSELEIHDRLEVFERICLAVHHAHQKGVIHRDIKPSNILVTEHDEVPVPKVIDFGIAKAIAAPLTDRTLETEMRHVLGTPKYMSPEQARVGSEDVDTRSDIYSLGIVLYELLTGTTPFETQLQTHDREEVQRVIREESAQRPSVCVRGTDDAHEQRAHRRRTDPQGLSRALRGDLDWIALKAIDKDRNRRYESAAALAKDVRRYLAYEPVLARRPGTAYLLWKFVQRHQVAATAIVAITTALVIGLVLAMSGLQRAEEQTELAKRQLRDLYVAQARASRNSTRPGRRTDSLLALQRAAELRSAVDLRDEMIASLTLTDVAREPAVPVEGIVRNRGPRMHDYLVTWSDGRARVVSAGTGEVIGEIGGPESLPRTAALSPRGEHLAIVDQADRLDVWDVATGRHRLTVPATRFRWEGVAFDRGASPPRWIAVAETDAIRVYALDSGSRWRRLPAPTEGSVTLVSSPDGRALAVTTDADETEVVIHALEAGAGTARLTPPAGLYALDWSPDGALLAGASADTNVYLWTVADGRLLRVLRGHQAPAVQVNFTSAGDVLASYSWDNTTRLWHIALGDPMIGPLFGDRMLGLADRLLTIRGDTVDAWRIERAPELRRAQATPNFGAPARVDVTPDGAWIATAGANGVRVWDSRTLAQVAAATDQVARSVHFLDAGRRLVVGHDDEVRIWRLGGRSLDSERLAAFEGLRATRLDPGGTSVWVIDLNGVHQVDIGSGDVTHRLDYLDGMATTPSISPDSKWLFTGTWKGEPATVWSLESGEAVERYAGSHVIGEFSPDGRWLCVSDGGSHRFYEVGTWRLAHRHPRGGSDDLAGSIAFAADGRTAAVAYSRYETQLIRPEDGHVFATLENPGGVASSMLALDREGDTLAVVSPARDLLAWDLRRIRAQLAEMGLDWRDD